MSLCGFSDLSSTWHSHGEPVAIWLYELKRSHKRIVGGNGDYLDEPGSVTHFANLHRRCCDDRINGLQVEFKPIGTREAQETLCLGDIREFMSSTVGGGIKFLFLFWNPSFSCMVLLNLMKIAFA